jgi:hypothetical protein
MKWRKRSVAGLHEHFDEALLQEDYQRQLEFGIII